MTGADPGFLKGGGGGSISGAETGFPEGGGAFTSTPPLDIVRVTSSTLRKIEKHPHLDIRKQPPPLDSARVTSSTFQGGGGDRSRSRTLCIGFQYRDKFKGGGGDHPCHPPWIRHCILGLQAKRGGVQLWAQC